MDRMVGYGTNMAIKYEYESRTKITSLYVVRMSLRLSVFDAIFSEDIIKKYHEQYSYIPLETFSGCKSECFMKIDKAFVEEITSGVWL